MKLPLFVHDEKDQWMILFEMILDDSHVTWRAVSGKERGWNGGKHGDQGMYKYHVVQLQSGSCLFSLYLISVNSLCESSILQPLYNSKINLCHITIHQIFSLARDWSLHVTEFVPAKTRKCIRVIFACCEKYLKDNLHNSLHLARKYTGLFALGHFLLREANSFSTLSENCSLRSK